MAEEWIPTSKYAVLIKSESKFLEGLLRVVLTGLAWKYMYTPKCFSWPALLIAVRVNQFSQFTLYTKSECNLLLPNNYENDNNYVCFQRQSYKLVSVKLDISAPHIILPEDFKSKQSSLVSKISPAPSVVTPPLQSCSFKSVLLYL